MSRVYQKPASTVRRAPGARPPVRPPPPTSGISTTHGTRAPTRGGLVRPPVPRQEDRASQSLPRNPPRTLQDRTTRVGSVPSFLEDNHSTMMLAFLVMVFK